MECERGQREVRRKMKQEEREEEGVRWKGGRTRGRKGKNKIRGNGEK